MRPMTRNPKPVLTALILLSMFAIAPLAHPGLWQTEKGFLPIYTVLHIRNVGPLAALQPWTTPVGPLLPGALREGPPPYLIAYGLSWIGLSPLHALKIVAALALITAALTTYLLATDIFAHPINGLLAGLLYLYAPPLLTTLYVRGRLAELWALALLPALIWTQRRSRRLPDLALRFLVAALITLCQPGLAIFLVGLAVVYGLWREVTPERFRLTALSTVAGLAAGLAAWSLMLVGTTTTQTVPFLQRFLYPADLLGPIWPTAFSDEGPPLGIAVVLLTVFALYRLPRLRHTSDTWRDTALLLAAPRR